MSHEFKLTYDDKADATMQAMMTRENITDLSELIRRALALFDAASQHIDEGGIIILVDGYKNVEVVKDKLIFK